MTMRNLCGPPPALALKHKTLHNRVPVKAEYINPFLNATMNVFAKTFSVDPEVREPYIVDDFVRHRWEISGVMVLTGSAIGVVAVRLSRFLSSKLLEKSGLTARNEEERENLTSSMVSELVNVISGNAATELTDYRIKVSVPFVVQGENHSISWPDRAPVIGIPFTTSFGPFAVYVSLIDLRSSGGGGGSKSASGAKKR